MGAGALWGLAFLTPELVRDFTPLQLATGRYLAYGILSASPIGTRWRALLTAITRREWLSFAWLSLAGNTLYYVLLSAAIQSDGIAMTSPVIGFLPVAMTIIGKRDHGAVPLRKLILPLLPCAGGRRRRSPRRHPDRSGRNWWALPPPREHDTEGPLRKLLPGKPPSRYALGP